MSKLAAAVSSPFQSSPQPTGDSASRIANDRIVFKNMAKMRDLSGSATSNVNFDAEALKVGGDHLSTAKAEKEQAQLVSLIDAFNSRQNEVRQRMLEPGSSQTRLSMVQ